MIVSTTPTIEGQTISSYLGVVCASDQVSNAELNAMDKPYLRAEKKLRAQAEKLGANAIVDIKVEFKRDNTTSALMIVLVTGTAVTAG